MAEENESPSVMVQADATASRSEEAADACSRAAPPLRDHDHLAARRQPHRFHRLTLRSLLMLLWSCPFIFWFNGDRFIAGVFSRPATLSSIYTGIFSRPATLSSTYTGAYVKAKMDVMKPWIAKRFTELLGFEVEVLIYFIYGLLEKLTGFMEKNTVKFMKELGASGASSLVHSRMPVGCLNGFWMKRRLTFIFYKFYHVLSWRK